jgi:hypothetical protein
MRPRYGRAFSGRASAAILYTVRAIGPRWRTGAGARAWLLQPSGPRPEGGMDSDMGPAVRVPGVRPHDEPFAGLAASVAVVCSGGHHGSALPAFDSGGGGARDRSAVRTQCGFERMAKSAAVAGAVVGMADIVGLAGIPAGAEPAGKEPKPRPAASDAMARRDAGRLGIGDESSRRVGGGGTGKLEGIGSQSAAGLADDSVPSGNRFRVWFWIKANGTAHRGRLWPRAAALVMLGSIP